MIIAGIFAVNFSKFLNTENAFDTHILGNFHGIGTPGSDHFAAGANEKPGHFAFANLPGFTEKPFQLWDVDAVYICLMVYRVNRFFFTKVEDHAKSVFTVQR
jgi:hypothetical protein